MEARCNLTGFVEAEAIAKANSKTVWGFFWRRIVCQYGLSVMITVDGGLENKGEVTKFLQELDIFKVTTSSYNARANDIIENGHIPIASVIAKYTNGTGKDWIKLLSTVLFADRMLIRGSYGCSPFYLMYGYDPVLTIEIVVSTWRVLAWEKTMDSHDHLQERLKMLECKEEDVKRAYDAVLAFRQTLVKRRDEANKYRFRPANAKL